MKTAIVVGYQDDNIAKAQRDPFLYNIKHLEKQLHLKVKHFYADTFQEIGTICESQNPDIIFLLPTWKESLTEQKLNEAEEVVQRLREKNNDRKLIFIDPFAQATTNYFQLLPYVDFFLKRQCYQDTQRYKENFEGGMMMTDFSSKQLNIDLDGWYVGSECPDAHIQKILPGWNLGTAKKFKDELLKQPLFNFGKRTKEIDIFCRLSLGNNQNENWYTQYRKAALEEVYPLEKDYKVVFTSNSTAASVPPRQYNKELRSSRLVFSPFGWGEGCWRDFEAVCYDCLLIKPSMAHLNSEPNIYIESETYVAVEWDFSNLIEKCRYYLENPDEATRIINNARQAYISYFKDDKFLEKLKFLIG